MSMLSTFSLRRICTLAFAAIVIFAATASQVSAGTVYAIDDQNNLFMFDHETPQNITNGVFLTGLKPNEHLVGIDFRPSDTKLYGIGSSYQVYTVDPLTGVCVPAAGTFAGAPGSVQGNSFGMDFNPIPDLIRFVSDTDQNLRINPTTGLLTSADTPLTYKTGDPNFGVNPNVVGAGYTNSVSPAPSATTLYGIDSNTNSLVRIGGLNGGAPEGSPNAGLITTVGLLGLDVNNLVGFDISANNLGIAALSNGGNSGLYGIDLSTGVINANFGQIIGGVRVVDITLQPGVTFNVPEPTSAALLALGSLAMCAVYRRRQAARASM